MCVLKMSNGNHCLKTTLAREIVHSPLPMVAQSELKMKNRRDVPSGIPLKGTLGGAPVDISGKHATSALARHCVLGEALGELLLERIAASETREFVTTFNCKIFLTGFNHQNRSRACFTL